MRKNQNRFSKNHTNNTIRRCIYKLDILNSFPQKDVFHTNLEIIY
nr:MAG TPA: hypothetical protein [Caudoviricetes sp.]